ncbi:MAG: transposase [Lachnospiraceae bacterium]|nr:transposase [Lachnospiraceae bacterium]
MDVRNCRGCGKLFNYISGPFICPSCREKMEEKFQEVKKYIQENPGSNVSMVAEACDVEPNQIRQWIREERLEFASGASEISCEKCGAPIPSGRFCDKCKASMVNTLNNVYKPEAPVQQRRDNSDGGPKMRFLS